MKKSKRYIQIWKPINEGKKWREKKNHFPIACMHMNPKSYTEKESCLIQQTRVELEILDPNGDAGEAVSWAVAGMRGGARMELQGMSNGGVGLTSGAEGAGG